MFWVQALTEVKVLNVVSTIFYVYRGLNLSQIFYLAIAFAAVSVLTEIPSSYLADKWSRKKLIIISLFIGAIYWFLNINAHSFSAFLVATSLYALAYSIMSGTDEALVYDTAKELGEETNSLKKLGQFYSGQRIFKIITPIIAVLLAKNLTDWQFNLIISIDIIANLIAIFLASKIVEPEHHLKVEKIESGVMLDAVKLLSHNPKLLSLILNRSLVFVSSFAIWRISSDYFYGLGIPILFIGLVTSFNQLTIFIFNLNSHYWLRNFSSARIINYLNLVNLIVVSLFLLNQILFKNWAFSLFLYYIILASETIRWPYFSDLFNKNSFSYNRATTLSLASFLNSLLQIFIFTIGSTLVSLNIAYLFAMSLAMVLTVNLFFKTQE